MGRSPASYIAFCDQDDISRPDKLACCMTRMLEMESQHGRATPILIYSDMKPGSSDGTILAEAYWKRAGVRPEGASFRNL